VKSCLLFATARLPPFHPNQRRAPSTIIAARQVLFLGTYLMIGKMVSQAEDVYCTVSLSAPKKKKNNNNNKKKEDE
jgi:hypothetical protein